MTVNQIVLQYVNLGVLTLIHLAGVIVAVILLVRTKGTPAILGTVAFAALLLRDVGTIMRATFLERLIFQQTPIRSAMVARGGLDCCCNVFTVIAMACLIVALWQAVSGAGSSGGSSEEIAGGTG